MTIERGVEQTLGYMAQCGAEEGHLVVIGRRTEAGEGRGGGARRSAAATGAKRVRASAGGKAARWSSGCCSASSGVAKPGPANP